MRWFVGTPHETRICPRRHLLQHPDVGGALALWRACEGKAGVEGLRAMSTHAVAAFAVIDAGRAAKVEEDAKRRAMPEPSEPLKLPKRRRKT